MVIVYSSSDDGQVKYSVFQVQYRVKFFSACFKTSLGNTFPVYPNWVKLGRRLKEYQSIFTQMAQKDARLVKCNVKFF